MRASVSRQGRWGSKSSAEGDDDWACLGSDVGRAGFVRCLPNGCVSEVLMDDNLIGKLRSGKQAMFIIFQTPEEGIGFPMSLKGFSEGYGRLP